MNDGVDLDDIAGTLTPYETWERLKRKKRRKGAGE